MANTRSAEKQERQAIKSAARNRAGKSRLRTALKKSRSAVAGGNTEPATLAAGFSEIDKAAKRGIIKKNAAARKKAQVARLFKATA